MTEQECANRAASIILQAKDCIRRYKLREGEKDRAFMLLGGLREHESRTGQPVTITEMARVSGLAVPNVSRLIKPYEEAGLLRREKQGRTVHIAITPKGEELLARRKKAFAENIAAVLSVHGEEERGIFLACGEKLLAKLEEHLQRQDTGENGC